MLLHGTQLTAGLGGERKCGQAPERPPQEPLTKATAPHTAKHFGCPQGVKTKGTKRERRDWKGPRTQRGERKGRGRPQYHIPMLMKSAHTLRAGTTTQHPKRPSQARLSAPLPLCPSPAPTLPMHQARFSAPRTSSHTPHAPSGLLEVVSSTRSEVSASGRFWK